VKRGRVNANASRPTVAMGDETAANVEAVAHEEVVRGARRTAEAAQRRRTPQAQPKRRK
jgi:hypothetical protein